MTAEDVRRATIRISHEIVEKHAGTDGLALVGIQRRGVPLAHRIAAAIRVRPEVVLVAPEEVLRVTLQEDKRKPVIFFDRRTV